MIAFRAGQSRLGLAVRVPQGVGVVRLGGRVGEAGAVSAVALLAEAASFDPATPTLCPSPQGGGKSALDPEDDPLPSLRSPGMTLSGVTTSWPGLSRPSRSWGRCGFPIGITGTRPVMTSRVLFPLERSGGNGIHGSEPRPPFPSPLSGGPGWGCEREPLKVWRTHPHLHLLLTASRVFPTCASKSPSQASLRGVGRRARRAPCASTAHGEIASRRGRCLGRALLLL